MKTILRIVALSLLLVTAGPAPVLASGPGIPPTPPTCLPPNCPSR